MEPNRWFKVLVLGGALLAQSCGSPSNARLNPPGTGGSSGPDAGADGGAGGTGGRDAGSTADASGTGGESASASGGSGGSSGGGGAGSGGGSAGGAAGSGGEGGAGGSSGPLQCWTSATGHGDPRDPCGCPCCWANDCPNTNAACCAGFCQAGDSGRGCCNK